MRGIAAQPLSSWQPAPETTQSFEHLVSAGLALDPQSTAVSQEVDLIALF
jgi:hypothetical protein